MTSKAEIPVIIFLIIVCFIMLHFVAATAKADILTWEWTPPTERTDGTALLPEDIEGYGFMLNGVEHPSLLTGGENNLILDIPLGEQCGSFSTVDTEGRRSVWTDPVCTTAKGPPGKPSSVNVHIVRPKRN